MVNWRRSMRGNMNLELEIGRNVVGKWGVFIRPGTGFLGRIFPAPIAGISKAAFAFNDNDEELGEKLFYINNQQIKLTKPMMPAMLTLDEAIIRQDCFCYLMERLPHPEIPYAN